MAECSKYLDQISAYADGELNEEESQKLLSHISTCPDCSAILNMYMEISVLSNENVDVPVQLKDSVMQEVRKINSAKKKSRKVIIMRWAAAAACFVLVSFAAVSAFSGKFSAKSSDSSSNENASMANFYSFSDSISGYVDHETSESAKSTDSQDADLNFADNSESQSEDYMSAPENEAVANEPASNDLTADFDAYSDIKNLNFDNYHSIVYIDGTLPSELESSDWQDIDESSKYLVMDAESAEKLSESGYSAELYDTESDVALVIWTP